MDAQTERLLEQGAVLLEPQGPAKLTEYGKRFFNKRLENIDRFWATVLDVLVEGNHLRATWPAIEAKLQAEGVPTAISSGLSGYAMTHLLDHVNGKTSFTMPAAVAVALGTAAPTVSTTGAWGTTESTNYVGYARLTVTTANWTAASGTNPAAATYSSAGSVTFAACTSGSATELGFLVADSATIGAGNALWYGTLASVTISTTQTPPTIATNGLSVSMNGT